MGLKVSTVHFLRNPNTYFFEFLLSMATHVDVEFEACKGLSYHLIRDVAPLSFKVGQSLCLDGECQRLHGPHYISSEYYILFSDVLL